MWNAKGIFWSHSHTFGDKSFRQSNSNLVWNSKELRTSLHLRRTAIPNSGACRRGWAPKQIRPWMGLWSWPGWRAPDPYSITLTTPYLRSDIHGKRERGTTKEVIATSVSKFLLSISYFWRLYYGYSTNQVNKCSFHWTQYTITIKVLLIPKILSYATFEIVLLWSSTNL